MDYESVPRDRLGGRMTPVIPKFYYEVDSQEQRIKIICCLIQELIEGVNSAEQISEETRKRVSELEKEFEEFKNHGFEDYYREQIEKWFDDNAWLIYQLIAKQVFFGLTDDGYFCAYVPDSWGEITFDTGAVFGRSDYGRLCLKFEADGQGVIDNTYGYSLNESDYSPTEIEALNARLDSMVADLEVTTRRGDSAFNTLFTNMDKTVVNGGENV